MPALKPEQYPEALKHPYVQGVFVGGCVERGDGSRFRAKAHAHSSGTQFEGWICFLSAKRLASRELCLHELAHIITGEGHTDPWRAKLLEIGGTLDEVPGILKSYHKKARGPRREPRNLMLGGHLTGGRAIPAAEYRALQRAKAAS